MAGLTSITSALANRIKRRKLPNVDAPKVEDQSLRMYLESVKEHLRMYEGDSSAPKERFVTIDELEAAGLIRATVRNKFASIDDVDAVNAAGDPVSSVSYTVLPGGGGGGGASTLAALTDTAVTGAVVNQPLVWAGSSWVPGPYIGDVFKVGTPVDNQLAIWKGDGLIEGISQITFSSQQLIFGDFISAAFGAGVDSQIYYDSSNDEIIIGAIGTTDFVVELAAVETAIWAEAEGGVHLYYDNGEKLVTTAAGVTVYGVATATAAAVDYIDFDLAAAYSVGIGEAAWNNDDGTLDIGLLGGEVVLQVGQEVNAYAKATEDILNGDTVYAAGAVGASGKIEVRKFVADATIPAILYAGIATEDIATGEFGYVTVIGFVRGIDTTGQGGETWGEGTLLYCSPTTAGGLTNVPPVASDQTIPTAFVVNAHVNNGSIYVRPTNPFNLAEQHDTHFTGVAGNEVISWDAAAERWENSLIRLNNFDADLVSMVEIQIGIALDSPVVTAASNGTTITLSMEKSGTGDIRFLFSSGVTTVDCTDPIASIALTPGSDDENPQMNYIYVLESTGALAVSTAGWPSAEHAPIATALCQTAASAQTDGLYKVHAWTDHTSSDYTGHLAHINYWVRTQPATWISGVALTVTDGAGTFDVATTTGVVLQLHPHAMPAINTASGGDVHIINDSVTAYLQAADLSGIDADANGDLLNNKYFNVVVWGVVSEDSVDSHLMVNLPSGSYNISADAQTDIDGTAVYTIPPDFRGVGFLISRLTMRLTGGTTYTEVLNTDLRGSFPSVTAGGSGGGGGGGGLNNVVEDLSPEFSADLNLVTGAALFIWDGGNTDNVAMSHDGTDFNVAGTNTADINVTGITSFNVPALASVGAVTGSNLNVANWDTAYGWGDWAGHAHELDELDATAITDGYVLTADGAGNAVWEAAAGGGSGDMLLGTDQTITAEHNYTHANVAPGAGSMLTTDMLYLDAKEAIDGADTWLRLNNNGDFGSGVFIPTQLRVDAATGVDIRDATGAKSCTHITDLVNHNINGTGLTNLDIVGFSGDVHLQGGVGLIIDSIGSAGNFAFNNNGSTLGIVGTSMVDIVITGLTGFAAGNYAFTVGQTVGAGQDNYVLTYDDALGTISLEATGAAGGNMTDNVAETITALHNYTVTDTGPGAGSALTTNMLFLDAKEAIDGADGWLRLNHNGDFASGTFLNKQLRIDAGTGLDLRDATGADTLTFNMNGTDLLISGGGTIRDVSWSSITGSYKFDQPLLVDALGVPHYVTATYASAQITVAASAPGSPAKGDIWFDTS